MLRFCLFLFTIESVFTMSAQTPPPQGMPPVPTTKILAIGRINGSPTPEMRRDIMPSEVRDTVQLYLAGKIDQWYVRKDKNGVVFLLNVPTVEEAHKLLEQLPLGKAKIMDFDLIPLGPLSPLAFLINGGSPTQTPPDK